MGEKVLILVPMAEHRLLAQWRGPYEVTERVSSVNYVIKQPDRRKKVQLYHINLLKYHGREEGVALMDVEDKENRRPCYRCAMAELACRTKTARLAPGPPVRS